MRWTHETVQLNVSGITPTAGGLLFAGELTGVAMALDADTGRVLWRHATGNGIAGGVITYEVAGKQYVAFAAGIVSPNWPAPAESNRIIVFALPSGPGGRTADRRDGGLREAPAAELAAIPGFPARTSGPGARPTAPAAPRR